ATPPSAVLTTTARRAASRASSAPPPTLSSLAAASSNRDARHSGARRGAGGSFLISPPSPTPRSATGKRSIRVMPAPPVRSDDQNASRSWPIGVTTPAATIATGSRTGRAPGLGEERPGRRARARPAAPAAGARPHAVGLRRRVGRDDRPEADGPAR